MIIIIQLINRDVCVVRTFKTKFTLNVQFMELTNRFWEFVLKILSLDFFFKVASCS